MKRIIILMLCVVTLLLTGCNATADALLQNGHSGEADVVDDLKIYASQDSEGSLPEESEATEKAEPDMTDGEATSIYVYICGAVDNPGVYELPAGSRIFQLVDEAGGLLEEADQNSINLADTLEDGQMVRIFTAEEAAEYAISDPGTMGIEQEMTSSGTSADGKIDLNTASLEQLQTLSGIGERKAADIVAYRESNGAFQSTEEVMNVSGIGESTYDKIKDYISVK